MMRNKVPNIQAEIYDLLGGRKIALNINLIPVTGSLNASIILAQLLYWQGKGSKGDWVYKTVKDMQSEIGLTRSQQDTAIALLKSRGLVEVERRSVPATRHFRVNKMAVIASIARLRQSGELPSVKPSIQSVGNLPTSTEMYPEKYTKKNEDKLLKFKNMKDQYFYKPNPP